MLKSQHKNTNMNSQYNMPSPEASNFMVIGPKQCNLGEAQDKDFRIANMNMFKDLKEDRNKCLNEDSENRNG
jgi:hypothetical protein